MIVRKNPSADIGRYGNMFFAIGLAASLAIVNVAFEWKFRDDGDIANLNGDVNSMFDEIELEDVEIKIDLEITEDMVIQKVEEVDFGEVEEETADEIFTIVEEQPSPPGGLEGFYKYVFKEIKYPNLALRSNVEGKVFVQFVVEKDGTLTNFIVARGIGAGCDEEAVRVLQAAPKWNPGKQRGKPVRVKMILPITFKLLN